MKVAEVVSTFPPYKAGIGNVAYYNSWLLVRLGHEVTVFTPRQSFFTHYIDEYPFQVKRLYPWFKYGNAGILPQLLYKLPSYDVVHLHYPFFGGAEMIYLLDKIKDIKLVLTYHMDVVGTGLLKKFFDFHTKNVLPHILNRADKIIVTSWDYAENSNIKERIKIEPEKFHEVPCGVNHLLFKPRFKDKDLIKKYNLYDKKIILFVGALDKAHYFKGVNILIQAIKNLPTNDDFRLLIVGEGDLKESYESMVDSFGLGKKIIFTGYVRDKELPQYYNLADLLVSPSTDKSEAFGIVLIEAMSSGLPVIAGDLAGVRSVVDKQKTGLLVKLNDIENLTKMIKFLLDNPRTAKEYGQAGRKKILELYTWERIGVKLDNVFKSIK